MSNSGPRTDDATTRITAGAVHVLAKRPDLRDLFPYADQVDMWIRWGA